MPYNHPIPDAPIGLSMLPRAAAADLKKKDLLYLVKPGNNLGERCKSLELEDLFSSDLFKFVGVYNSVIKSNILEYSGALASASLDSFTEVCHLDVDPRMDVEFHVWGTSNQAGASGDTYSNFEYGLRARTRQMYLPDDQDRDLVVFGGYAGRKDADGGPSTPAYNAVFGLYPINYNPSAEKLAYHPTKRVTLFLAAGADLNPYHATIPSEFNLKIQATIYPSKYVNDILAATTP
jgi:hypothetical protein